MRDNPGYFTALMSCQRSNDRKTRNVFSSKYDVNTSKPTVFTLRKAGKNNQLYSVPGFFAGFPVLRKFLLKRNHPYTAESTGRLFHPSLMIATSACSGRKVGPGG